ncbi:MAG: sensor histidine kinase, partial [Dehalococcoidia bacterium]
MKDFDKVKSILRDEPAMFLPGRPSATPITASHSPVHLLMIIILSIFVAESVIMISFAFLPPLATPLKALLDSTLLLGLLAPTLYFFLYRPLILHITERKREEKAAAIGRLAAGVAHELNNPLGNILLFSKLLLEDCPPGDERREGLNRLVENAVRGKRIISALLDFTRQTTIQREPCDLKTLAEASLEVVDPAMSQAPIEVALAAEEGLPPVSCDRSQIQQVFVNLVQNAIEAVTAQGSIAIFIRRSLDGKEVVFEVRDTGP